MGEKLEAEGIKVVAGSVDSNDIVAKTVEKTKANFPVAYDLDPVLISEKTGAMYQPDKGDKPRPFLHSTNFLLSPDGKVNISLYSSGPLGKLVWQDIIQAVQFRKKKMASEK